MQTENTLKELVKEKYGEIAEQSRSQNASSCCGSGCCSDEVYNLMADDYTKLEGYAADADLGLGCGRRHAQYRVGIGMLTHHRLSPPKRGGWLPGIGGQPGTTAVSGPSACLPMGPAGFSSWGLRSAEEDH